MRLADFDGQAGYDAECAKYVQTVRALATMDTLGFGQGGAN